MSKKLFYVSSKLRHRQKWLDSRLTTVSSWLENEQPMTDTDDFDGMWNDYRRDMTWADAFALFLEEDDVPKGALVELGMAFLLGLPVWIVWKGTKKELAAKLGTVVYHDSVTVVETIEEIPA